MNSRTDPWLTTLDELAGPGGLAIGTGVLPRSAECIGTTCEAIINELIDRHIHSGYCDAVLDIALPYPIPIISATHGVHSRVWELFSDCLRAICTAFDVNAMPHTSTILAAWHQLNTLSHPATRQAHLTHTSTTLGLSSHVQLAQEAAERGMTSDGCAAAPT